MYLLTNDEKAFGFIVTPKPPLLAVVIVPRGFCPKMRPC
ncbi:rfbP protein [Vibrio cholerae]|nr:rfbP protein [Vibrio cholerae]